VNKARYSQPPACFGCLAVLDAVVIDMIEYSCVIELKGHM
jgi:hypothetical protein